MSDDEILACIQFAKQEGLAGADEALKRYKRIQKTIAFLPEFTLAAVDWMSMLPPERLRLLRYEPDRILKKSREAFGWIVGVYK